METMHFHIAQTGSILELFFAFGGLNGQFSTQEKNSLGVQGKLNWPGLYCSLICIEPECLLS